MTDKRASRIILLAVKLKCEFSILYILGNIYKPVGQIVDGVP